MNLILNSVWRIGLCALALTSSLSGLAEGAEICHYSGTTDHSGIVEIETRADSPVTPSVLQVTLQFRASAFFQKIDYRVEELTNWNHGVLRSVAINSRYLLNGSVNKQIWDLFTASRSGFEGYRIQGKTPQDISAQHSAFMSHWDPRQFAAPWVSDYVNSQPERRPDLDLAASDLVSGLKTPLAMAFYFVRFLPRTAQVAPLFVAGEKKQKRLDLPLAAPESSASSPGLAIWQVPLHFGAISTPANRPARLSVTADSQLTLLDLYIQHDLVSAHGTITRQGCQEVD